LHGPTVQTFRLLVAGLLGACTVGGGAALAQVRVDVRPDAGTLLESPGPLPVLPPRSGPLLDLPARITPAAFSFTGNTVFSGEVLAGLLAARVKQPTDLAGLTQAAGVVQAHYRAQGYLLTQVYLPEQAFPAEGGTVTMAILEARVGRVTVQVEGEGLSRSFAEDIVASQLRRGDAVTEYALDKPVLLLRDLAGYTASATVEPGERPGEADVRVLVSAQGARADGSVAVDNHGARAAGAARLIFSGNVYNLLGRGDALALSAQQSNQSGSALYRLGYSVPVGADGTL
jgi:hemolysin activation/secretion protein